MGGGDWHRDLEFVSAPLYSGTHALQIRIVDAGTFWFYVETEAVLSRLSSSTSRRLLIKRVEFCTESICRAYNVVFFFQGHLK